ncbi:M28 family peptidase [Psychroflexus montanilacus]|uniref:M28 family peptidase n=1 Tax=Psychroflexus montanilacus TaxID=2873598 RepID=UPI001CC8FA9A|nr:M28 family metallopeptidase [Psychroflexus montanilacus]MBZ9653022.1 M28 family metallopeptidase [Psychroflexus montanilacus]
MKTILTIAFFGFSTIFYAQVDTKVYDIVNEVSAEKLEYYVQNLVDFGTRNTFSDTKSDTRGIGAARRWIKSEFEEISSNCNNCLDVFFQGETVTPEDGNRIPKTAEILNVVAVQKGKKYPNSYIIMSGDIDSRASDTQDFETDAPGANDNATGMAGAMEAARVLSQYEFDHSIVYVGLSGEEQGLYGGQFLAKYAKENDWNIIGILNNDMIGNIEGVDGVIDNRTFRIFSEAHNPTETDRERQMKRFYGGEVDGESRQLARYVYETTKTYMPEMNPMMIYRLDRFGRGGHHKPFNDLGFPGIRIMEAHENYNQQHQDIRTENEIEYGDVIEHVNFDYVKKLTAVNAISMASLAWAPPAPTEVAIGGIVEPSVKLKWEQRNPSDVKGYKVYWRSTTSPTWDHFRYVENVNEITLDGIIIDNFFFGIASVDENGNESVVVFPSNILR